MNKKWRLFGSGIIIIVLLLAIAACSGGTESETTTPASPVPAFTPPASPPPTATSGVTTPPAASLPPSTPPAATGIPASPTSTGLTFAQTASAGQAVFAQSCATCHGSQGQGTAAPAVIGSNANLGRFKTAQGLLDFISQAMPLNAPGSLPDQDYLNVLGFLLVENDYVSGETEFNENQLQNIQLAN